MPFKSKQQARFMYSQHPKIAKKWSDEMKKDQKTEHPIKPLPKRKKGSKMTPAKTKAQVRKYTKKGGK